MDTKPLAFSISETCKIISVGRSTIYAAIKKGELTTCKVGRRTLVTASALQKWLDNLPSSKTKAGTTNMSEGSHE